MGLAFDKSTVRFKDVDGRLHVSLTNISKAVVNEYAGSEIMGGEEIGLDPNKLYRMLRDPDELKKAAPTFNNLPLLNKHIEVNAEKPEKDSIVGTTGSDAVFKEPYLMNSLAIWDADAIDGIEDESAKEISCSYWYDADMTAGSYEGEDYDGIMRNIRGNHVALVKAGRAGSDVYVFDSINEGVNDMKRRGLTGRVVAVAIKAALGKQILAKDSKFDVDAATAGITAKKWVLQKPAIAAKLAKVLGSDASIEDLTKLLDGLDGDVVAMDEEEPPAPTEENKPTEDADPHDAILQFLTAQGLNPDAIAQVKQMLSTEESEEMAMDATEEIDEETGKPRMASDAKRKAPKNYVSVKAMDAAIKASTDLAVKRVQEMNEALKIVTPYVGEMSLAFDSASEVYGAALEMLGVNVDGVHESAYKAILQAQPSKSATQQASLAADSRAVDLSWIAAATGGHTVRVI